VPVSKGQVVQDSDFKKKKKGKAFVFGKGKERADDQTSEEGGGPAPSLRRGKRKLFGEVWGKRVMWVVSKEGGGEGPCHPRISGSKDRKKNEGNYRG